MVLYYCRVLVISYDKFWTFQYFCDFNSRHVEVAFYFMFKGTVDLLRATTLHNDEALRRAYVLNFLYFNYGHWSLGGSTAAIRS
jgi:hypothetical protein